MIETIATWVGYFILSAWCLGFAVILAYDFVNRNEKGK